MCLRESTLVACHSLFQLVNDYAKVEISVQGKKEQESHNCATAGQLRGWRWSRRHGWVRHSPTALRTHSQIFLICRPHFRKHFYGGGSSPPENVDIPHLTLSPLCLESHRREDVKDKTRYKYKYKYCN